MPTHDQHGYFLAICDSVYAILKRREDPMSLKRAKAIKERSEQYMRDELDAALLRAEMENAYQDCNGHRYRIHDAETFLCHYCKNRIRKDAPSYHLCEEMKPGIYR
jgi:hypothetical protein